MVWISGTEGIPCLYSTSLIIWPLGTAHVFLFGELLSKGLTFMDKLDCFYPLDKIKCHKNKEIEGLKLTNLNIETCRTGFEYQNKPPVRIRAVCSLKLL